MKASALLLTLSLAPASALAVAPVFQYDYLDLGHTRLQPDGASTGGGAFADLSYSIMDEIQFRVDYASLSYPLGVNYKDYSVGLTGEEQLDPNTDLYTDVLYVDDRYDHLGAYVSDDGYRLAIGVRHHPQGWERLELDGYLAHNFIGTSNGAGSGSQHVYLPQPGNEAGVGALFNATSWLSLGLVLARDSTHTSTTTFKLRLYF